MTRVAVAHDWLVEYAGSERVVEQIRALYPSAPLYTSVLDAERLPGVFGDARPSWLQHVPGAVDHHEWFLPFMPLAWNLRRPIDDVDVVVTSSHACANAVRVADGIPRLTYCHTPMRYAWDFESEKARFPKPLRHAARLSMAYFRRWDQRKASRVTAFVANSSAVAARVLRSYGREARVIHPPVDTEFFAPDVTQERDRGTFLYVGRLVGYKRADLTIEAFADLPQFSLLVVGEGDLRARLEASAPPNVTFLGGVDAARLRRLYSTVQAMVFPAVEDFGIAMAEAQACGTPVVAARAGGALDIVEHGTSGHLVEPNDIDSLRRGIETVAGTEFDELALAATAQRFSGAAFRTRFGAAVDETIDDHRRSRRRPPGATSNDGRPAWSEVGE